MVGRGQRGCCSQRIWMVPALTALPVRNDLLVLGERVLASAVGEEGFCQGLPCGHGVRMHCTQAPLTFAENHAVEADCLAELPRGPIASGYFVADCGAFRVSGPVRALGVGERIRQHADGVLIEPSADEYPAER